MRKNQRQQLMVQLMKTHAIERQEDFVKLLKEAGADVTQATVSRDIKEMQLIKVANSIGYQYSLPQGKKLNVTDKLQRMLQDARMNCLLKDYFVMVKVAPGMGPAISSLIDQLQEPEILGTIGGDDTILVMCESNQQAAVFKDFIETLLD